MFILIDGGGNVLKHLIIIKFWVNLKWDRVNGKGWNKLVVTKSLGKVL